MINVSETVWIDKGSRIIDVLNEFPDINCKHMEDSKDFFNGEENPIEVLCTISKEDLTDDIDNDIITALSQFSGKIYLEGYELDYYLTESTNVTINVPFSDDKRMELHTVNVIGRFE